MVKLRIWQMEPHGQARGTLPYGPMRGEDMRRMERQPTHPGKIIREDYLKPLSMTINEFASVLGISRKTLSKIINERGAITPDMALRLSRAFNTTPDFWLNLQKNYDLWQAENASKEWQKVKPFPQNMLHHHHSPPRSEQSA